MTTMRAKVFWTGRSQAVRLPKEFRFEAETVSVRREGNAVVLEPIHDWPEGYAESFAGMPSDVRRPAQGKPEKREPIT
jgi:antitoxin VapB